MTVRRIGIEAVLVVLLFAFGCGGGLQTGKVPVDSELQEFEAPEDDEFLAEDDEEDEDEDSDDVGADVTEPQTAVPPTSSAATLPTSESNIF